MVSRRVGLLKKIFISPEWIYPAAKQTENNKLTNLTINIDHLNKDVFDLLCFDCE